MVVPPSTLTFKHAALPGDRRRVQRSVHSGLHVRACVRHTCFQSNRKRYDSWRDSPDRIWRCLRYVRRRVLHALLFPLMSSLLLSWLLLFWPNSGHQHSVSSKRRQHRSRCTRSALLHQHWRNDTHARFLNTHVDASHRGLQDHDANQQPALRCLQRKHRHWRSCREYHRLDLWLHLRISSCRNHTARCWPLQRCQCADHNALLQGTVRDLRQHIHTLHHLHRYSVSAAVCNSLQGRCICIRAPASTRVLPAPRQALALTPALSVCCYFALLSVLHFA